ncbi:macrolide family glycosyltransferase [Streptantibioticus silvisoli]|nr:macrolide family glycosyltransferase [Streptantibioticus silvisoli]
MSHHIAFLNNTGFGHVMPTIEVVAELVRRGHEVTYVTGHAHVDKVEPTGATVLGYESVLDGVDLTEMVTAQATARMPSVYLREGREAVRTLEAHLGDRRPDLVMYDLTLYHVGRILARKWDVPAVESFPALASNKSFSLLDKLIEKMGPGDPDNPALLAFLRELTALLAENGQSDTTIEDLMGREEALNIVYYTRSYQPAGATFGDHYVFVGPCLDTAAATERWTPPGDGRPVMLISLGTSVHRRPEFFRRCVETFKDLPWHVVMAVHKGIDPAELEPLPPNIEVRAWVPQMAVLREADVFISHAGLGSIMSALATGTPMVLLPGTPEHEINAQRVAELGLGRVIRDTAPGPERLRAAVQDVTADLMTRKRAARMRRDIDDAGGGARAADAIERHLAAHPGRRTAP